MRTRNFGGYILQEAVGGGMHTKVYKAHTSLAKPLYGSTVAIKMLYIKGGMLEKTRLVQQFEREAEIAMNLEHRNVVKVFNFGKYNRHYAMIMEYVEGENLKESLYEKKKYPFGVLLKICFEAGKGLDYIHKNNIVHKDVKPDNILVSGDFNVVKITDFGIAKLPGKLWKKDIFPKGGTVTKYGNISYVAPEQELGKADFCSDIYSYGIAVDEIITAKLQTANGDGDDYFTRIDRRSFLKKTGRQEIICEGLPLPETFKAIIKKATHNDCRERYHSMDELLKDLERFL